MVLGVNWEKDHGIRSKNNPREYIRKDGVGRKLFQAIRGSRELPVSLHRSQLLRQDGSGHQQIPLNFTMQEAVKQAADKRHSRWQTIIGATPRRGTLAF